MWRHLLGRARHGRLTQACKMHAYLPKHALVVLHTQGRGVVDQLVRTVRPPQPALEGLAQAVNTGALKPLEQQA